MTKEHECFGGGYIGPPSVPIPVDPCGYMTSEAPIVGCNRIRCRDCSSWVRHRDNGWLAQTPSKPREALWLYDHLDELEPPAIVHGTLYRIYTCRCGLGQYTAVAPKELWTMEQSWECAGHPA